MNAITFEVKQAHLRATSKGVALFKAAATRWKACLLEVMTPARFDILEAVYLHDEPFHQHKAAAGLPPIPRWRNMAGLVQVLGLAASTVSRGVKRLAELGLLAVRRMAHDRRFVEIFLTADGLEALALAKACLEHEPRALPGFTVEQDEEYQPSRTDPVEERGLNERVKDLVKIDRVAELDAEIWLRAYTDRRGGMIGTSEVMNHHFFRVVDHFRRIARFFGSKTRPLHDARDRTTFLLHLEGRGQGGVATARS